VRHFFWYGAEFDRIQHVQRAEFGVHLCARNPDRTLREFFDFHLAGEVSHGTSHVSAAAGRGDGDPDRGLAG
jgi:hypothetical protein